jgi:hypothetical protein
MDMPKYLTDQELDYIRQNIPKSPVEQNLAFSLSVHRDQLEKKFPELYKEGQVNVPSVNIMSDELRKQVTSEIENIKASEKESKL